MVRILLFVAVFSLLKCQPKDGALEKTISGITLNKETAENLARLPLKCIQTEYPNKLNQVLGDSTEYGTPKELHPAFYGCFDWHSSVHGHWMLVHIMAQFPDLKYQNEIKLLLKAQISKENIQKEVAYLMRKSEKSFERTYGWAWLLKLDEALLLWNDPLASELRLNLKPLTDLIVQRYLEFLPKLNYPIRSGEHPNTAFGLSLAYDYALSAKHDSLKVNIEKRANYFFSADKNCPLSWEPGGFDFLSPCLQEVDLMAKMLPKDDFKNWLDAFLPELKDKSFKMDVATVSDRTDGKLVHLDGVNFCRAWSLYSVVNKIPEYNHLTQVANEHVNASLNSIADGSYEGEHWLATFAVYALSQNKAPK